MGLYRSNSWMRLSIPKHQSVLLLQRRLKIRFLIGLPRFRKIAFPHRTANVFATLRSTDLLVPFEEFVIAFLSGGTSLQAQAIVEVNEDEDPTHILYFHFEFLMILLGFVSADLVAKKSKDPKQFVNAFTPHDMTMVLAALSLSFQGRHVLVPPTPKLTPASVVMTPEERTAADTVLILAHNAARTNKVKFWFSLTHSLVLLFHPLFHKPSFLSLLH